MTSSVIRKSERTIPGLIYLMLKTVWPLVVYIKCYGQIRMVRFFQKKTNGFKNKLKNSIRYPCLKYWILRDDIFTLIFRHHFSHKSPLEKTKPSTQNPSIKSTESVPKTTCRLRSPSNSGP